MKNSFRKPALPWLGILVLALLPGLLLGGVSSAQAQTETVLYTFDTISNGANPNGLIRDTRGNLYGTTFDGGAYGGGSVFKVSPAGVQTVLYSFNPPNSKDGFSPAAGLAIDKQGNLYGTTVYGGGTGCRSFGCGTVFKLSPAGKETILYNFNSDPRGKNGRQPYSAVVLDKNGNVYGTTYYGGTEPFAGTVFKVAPDGTHTVLHNFTGFGDGCQPYGAVVLDTEGNVYGTASACGANFEGAVFKVTPSGAESLLYSFGNEPFDGMTPIGNLSIDKEGNVYGTTIAEGTGIYYGTAFKVTPAGAETILHEFGSQSEDGENPTSGLIVDDAGNLYGTTTGGGTYGYGTVFELSPTGAETVLYNFNLGNGTDGFAPFAGLVMDHSGNLYGTTPQGGNNNSGYGTVFKVAP